VAEVNVCDYEVLQNYILSSPFCSGNLKCCQILLEHGANPTAVTTSGVTPSHFAAERGWLKVLQLLFYYGADLEAEDISKEKPIHLAEKYEHVECVEFLRAIEDFDDENDGFSSCDGGDDEEVSDGDEKEQREDSGVDDMAGRERVEGEIKEKRCIDIINIVDQEVEDDVGSVISVADGQDDISKVSRVEKEGEIEEKRCIDGDDDGDGDEEEEKHDCKNTGQNEFEVIQEEEHKELKPESKENCIIDLGEVNTEKIHEKTKSPQLGKQPQTNSKTEQYEASNCLNDREEIYELKGTGIN